MEKYTHKFAGEGYDLEIVTSLTADDLIALEITNPSHRKKMMKHIGRLQASFTPKQLKLPDSVGSWLRDIELEEYTDDFVSNGVDTVDKILDTTWENLQVRKQENCKIEQNKQVVYRATLHCSYLIVAV